jgi:hypothetical protein
MIAALIFVISFATLLQFFILHCRAIVAHSSMVELSDRVRDLTGIINHEVSAGEFHRLLQLVRLCPERGDDRKEIRVVRAYYALLQMIGATTRAVIPSISVWTENEQRGCSHFVAVALDRRISYSRDLFSQQVADRL